MPAVKTKPKQTTPPVEYRRVALTDLKPYERNPRAHPPAQIDLIARLMREYGQTMDILVDENLTILAGHARAKAAAKVGWKDVSVKVIRGLTKAQKQAYVIADNQSALMAEWDQDLLRLELGDLKRLDFDLNLTGFDAGSLVSFFAGGNLDGSPAASSEGDGDKGKLLDLINVTIDEPKHEVQAGDHYMLGKRHHLFCASVIADWQVWIGALQGGALFCPYAGIFVPFSDKAKNAALVMVQPDPYIAGHILDRYTEVNGKKSVIQVLS